MLALKLTLPLAFLILSSTLGQNFLPDGILDNRGKITLAMFVALNILLWPPHDQTWKPWKFEGTNRKRTIEVTIVVALHILLILGVFDFDGGIRGLGVTTD